MTSPWRDLARMGDKFHRVGEKGSNALCGVNVASVATRPSAEVYADLERSPQLEICSKCEKELAMRNPSPGLRRKRPPLPPDQRLVRDRLDEEKYLRAKNRDDLAKETKSPPSARTVSAGLPTLGKRRR